MTVPGERAGTNSPDALDGAFARPLCFACRATVDAGRVAAGDGSVVPLRKARSAALPGPVRAGADLGLLAVAAVAYWQLRRPSATGGALGADASGGASVDPVLVVAPALALLAGTVMLVLIVELLNSAIEAAIDRISFEIHDLSKRAKDIGSAAVFLSLLLCTGTWFTALYHRFTG